MFRQLLTPVGDSLGLSFLVAVLPVVAVLVLLGVLRRPAWQAALAGLVTGLVIAIGVWKMPVDLALDSVAAGAVLALWPVMWIVVNALLLYNIAVRSGRFDAFRHWVDDHLPNDRRVVLVVIGFCFGALLEGVAGFGTPVAITSSLLMLVGFPALEALVFVLIFNTAPVAFGGAGRPGHGARRRHRPAGDGPGRDDRPSVARHGALPAVLCDVDLRRPPLGPRSMAGPALVAGGSFAASQFIASNLLDYALTDVLASLGSLIVTLAVPPGLASAPTRNSWSRKRRSKANRRRRPSRLGKAGCRGCSCRRSSSSGRTSAGRRSGRPRSRWRGCTMRSRSPCTTTSPTPPSRAFQPLGTGTAILLSAVITAAIVRLSPGAFFGCVAKTFSQAWLAIITVMLIIGLAYLMNYSGLAYTLGHAVASTGYLFVLLSPFLGWVAVMLSGSDTSGNALFGNLQVVAARSWT